MADLTGEIETSKDGVLVIRRIHVHYALRADPAKQEQVDRALRVHRVKCPVARTLGGCVEITTDLELVSEA